MKFIRAGLIISLYILPLWGWAQTKTGGTIRGHIADEAGAALPFSTVAVDSLKTGTTADPDGYYQLHIPAGTYKLSTSMVGYKKLTKQVTVIAGKSTTLNFSLKESTKDLGEVTVVGEKNEVDKVREQSFTVNSIDVKRLQNINMDVNTILNRSTGIRIRQEGGLGSDFNFSLNGFSGNQVRFFIDGISADYMGSSMQFNNIPVNMIERIEVYKGVVPVNLGADALGGAVNIVTNNNTKDFLDLSYSAGSFNTHQAALTSRFKLKKHIVINASGFFNYSNNNFTIDAQVVDKNSGKISDPQPVKLFNEDYISGSAMVETGVVNTLWADRLLIGIIASGNKKNYQRGRAMVLNPAGEVHTTDMGITPTLKYQKKNLFTENLSLSISSIYSHMQAMNIDTSSRIYNWDGTYTVKTFGATSGELSWYKTMFRFNDRATFNTATLEYLFRKHHTFTINNTYSYFWRKGTDPVASQYDANVAFSDPHTLAKNITGFSYKLSAWQNRWNTTVFAKLFYLNAGVRVLNDVTEEFYPQKNTALEHGWGMATSLFVTKSMQLKASYEYTSRLPESYELFGDGLLLLPQVTLRPERSHNMNVGMLYGKRFKSGNLINLEGGFIYRLPQNMIRLVAVGVLSEYQNLSSARVMGGEVSVRYSYKQFVSLELNATYQDMRNNNKIINTYPDPLYLDRIPNIPYLFGNAMLGLTSPPMGKHKMQVGLNWATMYVEEFYLNWPSQGAKDTKYVIPRQLSHDVSLSLSALSGKYNISLSCWNISDSKLYDNYKVQKPGRSFNIKLRVYIDQFIKQPITN